MTPSQKALIKPRTRLFAGCQSPTARTGEGGCRQLAERAGNPTFGGSKGMSDAPVIEQIGAERFTTPRRSKAFARLSRALLSSASLSQRLGRAV
jgi:hypothetical protein